MIYFFGERDAGRVETYAGTYVETRFAHFNAMILVPTATLLVLPSGHRFAIPRHGVSLRAAYARLYPAILAGILGIVACMVDDHGLGALIGLGALGMGGLWLASFRYGTLSPEQIAQREVYRTVTGFGCDPALLVHAHEQLAANLQREISVRAERLAPDGYREGSSDWRALAARSAEADPHFLAIALTLARIAHDDALHAAIWRRLEPSAASLPSTIPPVVDVDVEAARAAEAAQQAAPVAPEVYVPPPVLETRRGSVLERGFDVTLPADAYVTPTVCASCLAPAEQHAPSRLAFRSKATVAIPYCRACLAHAQRAASSGLPGGVATLVVGLAAGSAALFTGPSLAVSLVVGVLAAAIASGLVASLFPARRAVVPATVARDAARLVGARGGRITLFCKSHEWSTRLAEAYGGERVARRRLDLRVFAVAAFATACAAPVAALAWHVGNPTVRVDNGTGAPVAIWVDGRVDTTVGATVDASLPTLRIPRGAHRLGWSPAGAAAPVAQDELVATLGGGDYLLDPDARHCYFVESRVYGKADSDASIARVRRVALLHDMTKVDDWFVDSPTSMQVDRRSGTVRYALKRFETCDELGECSIEARAKYWACIGASNGRDIDGCAPVAREACGW